MSGSLESFGSTSSGLILRAKNRAPDAWTRLVKLYGPLVFSWIQNAGLDATEAGDIFQETFRAVFAGIEKFEQREGGSFRGWLRVITQNKLRDYYRHKAMQAPGIGGSSAQQWIQSIPMAEEPSVEELSGIAHRALAMISHEFDPRTIQAFWRTVVDGVESPIVAEELGMTSNAVRLAKARILRRLRNELGDPGFRNP